MASDMTTTDPLATRADETIPSPPPAYAATRRDIIAEVDTYRECLTLAELAAWVACARDLVARRP